MRSSVWWCKTWHKKYAIMIFIQIFVYILNISYLLENSTQYMYFWNCFFFLLHKMSSVLCFQMTESVVTEQIIKKIVIVSKVILIFVSKNRNYEFQVDQMFNFFHFHRSTFVNVKVTRIKCNRFCYKKQNYF